MSRRGAESRERPSSQKKDQPSNTTEVKKKSAKKEKDPPAQRPQETVPGATGGTIV
jgi:hypothetical protein